MADRYWVGGTASWDGTAGTKWALTSGGAGGQSVPTTADDVFFSALSTGTCTIASGNTGAKSINCTGFTGTIAGTANITVAGSITLVSGMTWTHTGIKTITGTGTLISAGKNIGQLAVNGSGITVTLGDAYNTGGRTFELIAGTFDTANFSFSCSPFGSSNSNVRSLLFGSSTISVGNDSGVNLGNTTNLTFNAGTSQINLTPANPTLTGGGLTFYNVSFTNTSRGSRSISGTNTFNNLTCNASSDGPVTYLILSANQTVNGTLTFTGASANQRAGIFSNTQGTSRTITVASASLADCNFRDITIAGAASPISPTRAGDCGGNSGITFPAAKTAYRVGTNTSWVGVSSWALTSGGTGSNDNFPLPQDTAEINNDTTLTGTLNTGDTFRNVTVSSIDCTNRTTAITIQFSNCAFYGSLAFSSSVTTSSGGQVNLIHGRGANTITSNGITLNFNIDLDAFGGSLTLQDALTSSAGVSVIRGTFNANNYNLTCTRFNASIDNVRTVTMGSGLWTLSGTGTAVSSVWSFGLSTSNLTFNKDTANILFSDTTTTAREFRGAGQSFNKLTIGGATGTSVTTITGTNNFTELASTKTVAHTIRFTNNQGTIGTWSVTGTSGNVVTVDSSAAGTRRTFTLTNVTSGIDYLSVKDIGELSNNKFYVGANSTDGGNNLNVYFTAAPTTNNSSFFMLF